ncbi:MAG: transporter related, partial [Devosia sp.]|nr:transporter related [Devosia sp.]
RAELKELHARLKTTMIYVTHDQIEAMTMADVIVVMRDGVVEQVGRPLDLYDHPANVFVASFIGSPSMNLLTGTISSDGGAPNFVMADGTRLPIDAAKANAGQGRDVVYGIRPEHFVPAVGEGAFTGTIKMIEPTGSETHIVVIVGTLQIVVLLRERLDARPGDPIKLDVKPGAGHFFDAATGESIPGNVDAR